MIDIRQSPFWAAFMEELGWEALKLGEKGREQFVYTRKLPLFGNLLKAPRLALPIPFEKLDAYASDHKIAFAKIEPNVLDTEKKVLSDLRENKFSFDRFSLQPTKTIVIDLRKTEDELLAQMEKDTRYSVRASQRRGIRIVKSVDLRRFLKLYRQTAKRKGFWIPEKDLEILWDIFSNEGKGFILLAQWNKTDIAGCLILHFDKKAYYYHAASLPNYKELFAPYLLIWETMLHSKKLGLKELDLEGIYDQRIPSTKKWKGFSHFKKGFAGEEVELIGSFVKTYNPLYSLFYKLGNLHF